MTDQKHTPAVRVKEFSDYDGTEYVSGANELNKFLKQNPGIEVISTTSRTEERRWAQCRGCHMENHDIEHIYLIYRENTGPEHDETAAELARVKAEKKTLVVSLHKIMSYITDGTLVRDISKDAESDFTLKMMRFVADLQAANSAIAATATPDDLGLEIVVEAEGESK